MKGQPTIAPTNINGKLSMNNLVHLHSIITFKAYGTLLTWELIENSDNWKQTFLIHITADS